MTPLQILLFACGYLIELVVVIYFTRATVWRVIAAILGGAAAGLFSMCAIALCEELGWWHIPFEPTFYFVPMFYVCVSITLMPIYLVTWRLARRFGWRGLAVFVGIVAVIGPPRDYFIAAAFPKWMVFGPGIAPIVADCAAYIGIVLLGHAVMRLVGGHAGKDRLVRDPKSVAQP